MEKLISAAVSVIHKIGSNIEVKLHYLDDDLYREILYELEDWDEDLDQPILNDRKLAEQDSNATVSIEDENQCTVRVRAHGLDRVVNIGSYMIDMRYEVEMYERDRDQINYNNDEIPWEY